MQIARVLNQIVLQINQLAFLRRLVYYTPLRLPVSKELMELAIMITLQINVG